jgi:formylaminopyrimidine deformylase / aminopyrimidine aminohydrolase
MTTAALLAAVDWTPIVNHTFVRAAAAGTLPTTAFDRWVVADHHFVVGFRRFVGRLVDAAPDEAARDLLAGSFGPLQSELELFRTWADDHGLDLDAEPGPVTLGYTSYLAAVANDGWAHAVTALFGAERAYFDAWSAVRQSADVTSPWWTFIDNWSSDAFRAWVDDVSALVDRTVPEAEPVRHTFERVVRFEVRFWDAVEAGDDW